MLSDSPSAAGAAPEAALAYRPEVDGLRALAVVSVILFHAHVGPVTGGFVGVDVFFVISGFLITAILAREQAEGRLTLGRFYARRARRILPALLFVCACCVPAAALLMNSDELTDFFRMLAATAVAGSNFVLAVTTGYFDAPAESRPLLHTWSLAVEEQFYFLFPLFLLATVRLRRSRVMLLLGLAALASLALAEWGWRRHASANFYLAPGRAWELLAGGLCALGVAERAPWAVGVPRRWREGLAAAGLAAIVWACFAFGDQTPSPSAWLLVPVLGTAAVLLYGAQDTWVGRGLAWRPMVAIGLVSYSAYLWHQPLLAFARLFLQVPLPQAWRYGAIVLTFSLAAVTWKLVEQPFRKPRTASQRQTLWVALAASLGTLVVAGVGARFAGSVGVPLPASVLAAFEQPVRAKACFDVPLAHTNPDAWCRIHPGAEARPSFALWGDSHGLQVLEAFEAAARTAGRSGVFTGFSGCAPLLGVVPLTRPDQDRLDCVGLNQRMLAYARDNGIRDVFLVAKWSYYTDRWNGSSYINALGQRPGEPVSVENSRRAFSAGFAATLAAYAAIGARVHVLEQVPQQLLEPRAVYERAQRAAVPAQEVIDSLSVPLDRHRGLQAFPASVFRRADLPPHEILNVDDLFCDRQRCTVGLAGQPYYTDISHLSPAGALRLVPRLTEALRAPP